MNNAKLQWILQARHHLSMVLLVLLLGGFAAMAGCSAEEVRNSDDDFAFDGTCVNCHQGLSSGHVHAGFK
ncbi:MAG TPA: hypothetical protein PLF40_32180, partial [Kofleriaceae bacterium]|nr:hypothetical protein [Kofleriaceae bacterium]